MMTKECPVISSIMRGVMSVVSWWHHVDPGVPADRLLWWWLSGAENSSKGVCPLDARGLYEHDDMMIKIIMMMIMWQIWWWWECDSDWCLPPVTPGLCQPPELGPGSWGCPGPAWLWLLRLGPVSAGPESAVHPVLPHHLPHISVISVTLAPVSSGVCHPEVRNVKRTLAASSWHQTPAAGCKSRLWLSPDSEIIPLVG